jgi:hypothetical protein
MRELCLDEAFESVVGFHIMVASGPPATINDELRQARKGATVVMDLCAGVWLEVPPPPLIVSHLKTLCL